jgi:hypothetical protein
MEWNLKKSKLVLYFYLIYLIRNFILVIASLILFFGKRKQLRFGSSLFFNALLLYEISNLNSLISSNTFSSGFE